MARFSPLFALVVVASAACGPDASGPFDPRGDDVALYGEWDVYGEDPSMVDTCAEADIETVELAFFPVLEDDTSYTDDTFRFPCDYGVYDSVEPVLRHGWFRYRWRAYRPGATTPSFESAFYTIDVRDHGVTTFDLQAVDFAMMMAP